MGGEGTREIRKKGTAVSSFAKYKGSPRKVGLNSGQGHLLLFLSKSYILIQIIFMTNKRSGDKVGDHEPQVCWRGNCGIKVTGKREGEHKPSPNSVRG